MMEQLFGEQGPAASNARGSDTDVPVGDKLTEEDLKVFDSNLTSEMNDKMLEEAEQRHAAEEAVGFLISGS